MYHITYNVNTAKDLLSSGHILWNIYSTFILSFFTDFDVIPHNSWYNSSIITKNSFIKNTKKKEDKYEKTIIIDKYMKWESIDYNDFKEIIKLTNYYKSNHNSVLIILTNVCNIHPDIVYEWFLLKKITTDIYSSVLIPHIRNLYYYDNNKEIINAFAIHIRRGDLCKWTYENGFTINYYKNIINHINKYLNIPINIYTENHSNNTTTKLNIRAEERKNIDYSDIDILFKIKNVNIFKGDLNSFKKDFNQLCRSKYLLMSPSSFCLWAGFISNQKIYIDNKNKKCRPNCFKNIDIIPNFITYDDFTNITDF